MPGHPGRNAAWDYVLEKMNLLIPNALLALHLQTTPLRLLRLLRLVYPQRARLALLHM